MKGSSSRLSQALTVFEDSVGVGPLIVRVERVYMASGGDPDVAPLQTGPFGLPFKLQMTRFQKLTVSRRGLSVFMPIAHRLGERLRLLSLSWRERNMTSQADEAFAGYQASGPVPQDEGKK